MERGASDDVAPRFFYDLGSASSYLVAERINGLFIDATGAAPSWIPILAAELPGAVTGPPASDERMRLELQASAQGLPPIRWPDPWPGDLTFAMRIATFAADIGRGVSLPLYAFRQGFAAARDLSVPDNVLIAAAACELHPRALTTAAERPAIQAALETAGAKARAAGVTQVPAIVIAGTVFGSPEAALGAE